MSVKKQYKDRVFKFIFGNPDNKQWTLSLYNAINGSSYTDPEAIEINTIEEVLYIGMHNDVSFMIFDVLNIWEHQSTFNPNMPIRFFIHAAQLYDKYMTAHDCYRYGRFLIKLPCPKCICFYNGIDDQSEEIILSLADAFRRENEKTVDADIEVKVRMLNINYGKNEALMKACQPLWEYSWLVDRIRNNQKSGMDIERAVDQTLNEMSNDFAIKKFLLMNRAEVKGMFLTEYDEEKILKQERAEGWQEGRAKGLEEGRAEGLEEGIHGTRLCIATDMLKENVPLSLILKISKLSEDVIRGIAKNLGLTVLQ